MAGSGSDEVNDTSCERTEGILRETSCCANASDRCALSLGQFSGANTTTCLGSAPANDGKAMNPLADTSVSGPVFGWCVVQCVWSSIDRPR